MKKETKINVLPLSVIEKIAAGEVVERPASVVKELVENSIDSGASHIDIIIEDSGFSCIKIIDNGEGMGIDDLRKCLLPHTTSKIFSADDLFSVSSMGFRGEALSSISAVSRLNIASSNTEEGLGYSISSEGGAISEIAPKQRKKGTTVLCKDLFFNVPARKKFMKTRRAERMALINIIEQIAFSFPSIHFKCTVEGKRRFDLPEVETLDKRIAQIGGTEFAKKLIICYKDAENTSAKIYISDPQDARQRPRYQNLYVNLRRVDNNSVTYAVREAFSRFITSNLKPSWFCFLDIDPSRVDINIHPTKQMIKFDKEKDIFSFIYRTVHSSVSENVSVTHEIKRGDVAEMSFNHGNISFPYKGEKKDAGSYERIFKNEDSTAPKPGQVRENISIAESGYGIPLKSQEGAEQLSMSFLSLFNIDSALKKQDSDRKDSNADEAKEQKKLPEENFHGQISCFQIHNMFILAPIKNGIIFIDQHAAHERILYEEALNDIKRGNADSQRLLFPITFDMSTVEKDIAISYREYFDALGFDLQDFGGKTIAVSGLPAEGFIKSSNVEETVREIVQSLIDEKDREIISVPQKRFAASFACGAAIKFGQELKIEEMNMLLNKLFKTKEPNICPHGRPTYIRISTEELLRKFLR